MPLNLILLTLIRLTSASEGQFDLIVTLKDIDLLY